MKKIYIVDMWRRIKYTLITYFSIMLIVCLGISSYLGISFAHESMKRTGDYYFDKQKFHDIQITHNYGLTEEDIEKLKELEGVSEVEGVYQTTGFLKLQNMNRLVTVQSVTSRVNIATVILGRLPIKNNEIAIERVMADEDNIEVGTEIEIESMNADGDSILLKTKFKVVGIVEHPEYSCNYVYSRRGISEKGNGNCLNYLLVSDSAFDKEVLGKYYQNIIIWSEELSEYNCFSSQYKNKRAELKKRVLEISEEREKARYQTVWNETQNKVDEYREKLQTAEIQLEKSEADISRAENDINNYASQLEEVKNNYQNSSMVSEGERYLAEAEAKLKASKTEHSVAQADYNERKKQLTEAESEIDALPEVNWRISDRSLNVSYAMYSENVESLGKLSFSFAFIYIVVALLVCYSSIGRMITKQKLLIGTQKALGYRPREIYTQYVAYVWICTFWGCVCGILWAVFFVQEISLTSYKPMYYFEEYIRVFEPKLTVIAIGTTFLLTLLSAFLVCRKIISKPAVMLLKDDVPQDGRKVFFEKFRVWQKISLFKRTVIKNLLSEKRHMVTTIIGIGGCTALMVIGFTLQFAMNDVKDMQFNHIQKFDVSVQIEKESNSEVFAKVLDKLGQVEYLELINRMMRIRLNDEDDIMADLLVTDSANINDYFALEDVVTGEKVDVPKEGVLLSSNTARYYNLKSGDKIEIIKNNGESLLVPVSGIVKNYVCHFLIMSPEYYNKMIDDHANSNIFFVKLNGETKENVINSLKAKEGYITVSGKEMGISIFDNIVDSLNSVVQVMIVLSAVMSLVVVLNLMIMYINEKSKALAVMRINGYTLREVKAFITYSHILLNLLGLTVGIILGGILAVQILKILENSSVAYNLNINVKACVISCGICIIYSLVIGSIVKLKINKLPLHNLNRFD